RKEFSFTQFQRSFTLPDDVDPEKITGNYTNGILKLEIPHGAQAPKKEIEIK
ncbi:MAG: Hsp20/alpha crystallin family protein, partial [Bacteroidales bacterium]|nr:Hsp20/alpha crystallin family protein [Bacteroidales bacterium]